MKKWGPPPPAQASIPLFSKGRASCPKSISPGGTIAYRKWTWNYELSKNMPQLSHTTMEPLDRSGRMNLVGGNTVVQTGHLGPNLAGPAQHDKNDNPRMHFLCAIINRRIFTKVNNSQCSKLKDTAVPWRSLRTFFNHRCNEACCVRCFQWK
jgi:hypothetical protein